MLRILYISCFLLVLSGCPSAALLPARPLDASEVVVTASGEGLSNGFGGSASATVGLGGWGDVGGLASMGTTGLSLGVVGRVYFWRFALRLRALQESLAIGLSDPEDRSETHRRYLGQVELMSTPRRGRFEPYTSVLMSIGTDPVTGLEWKIGEAGPSVGFSFSQGVQIPLSDAFALQAELMVSPPLANPGARTPGAGTEVFWSGQARLGLVFSAYSERVAPPSQP